MVYQHPRMNWIDFKLEIGRIVGLDKDALHIYCGVSIQLIAALVLRRTLGAKLPWLCVLAAILFNEWMDLHVELWPDRWQQYRASIHDIVNTMILPTLVLLLVRRSSRLLTPQRRSPHDGSWID